MADIGLVLAVEEIRVVRCPEIEEAASGVTNS